MTRPAGSGRQVPYDASARPSFGRATHLRSRPVHTGLVASGLCPPDSIPSQPDEGTMGFGTVGSAALGLILSGSV